MTILDIWNYKCKEIDCYFYNPNKINKCNFYVGQDAGFRVIDCKDKKR